MLSLFARSHLPQIGESVRYTVFAGVASDEKFTRSLLRSSTPRRGNPIMSRVMSSPRSFFGSRSYPPDDHLPSPSFGGPSRSAGKEELQPPTLPVYVLQCWRPRHPSGWSSLHRWLGPPNEWTRPYECNSRHGRGTVRAGVIAYYWIVRNHFPLSWDDLSLFFS